jgi:hypothetical protein
MRLTMKERQSVIAVMQERYRKARKKLKRQILDECCQLTGYNRAYASHLLRHYKPALKRKEKAQGSSSSKKTTAPYYDVKVKQALVRIWMIMDCVCGKRLQPILSEIIPILEKHREIKLSREVREKLLKVSSATIDRLLAEEKKTLSVALVLTPSLGHCSRARFRSAPLANGMTPGRALSRSIW